MQTQTQTDSRGRVKIGLFGIGLDTYWAQFPRLESRLRGYVVLNLAPSAAIDYASFNQMGDRTLDANFLHLVEFGLCASLLIALEVIS